MTALLGSLIAIGAIGFSLVDDERAPWRTTGLLSLAAVIIGTGRLHSDETFITWLVWMTALAMAALTTHYRSR